jgi:multidrug efflux pump subunit AcrA (membrane-fusion protein)
MTAILVLRSAAVCMVCSVIGVSMVTADEVLPVVQIETLEKSDVADELTYPGRVTSKLQGVVTSDIDGIVLGIKTHLGQSLSAGQPLLTIKNTDPVYEYVSVTIKSPVAGVVSQIEINEGMTVRKGQKLATVIDPKRSVIEVEIPATDLPFLKVGLQGTFEIFDKLKVESTIVGLSPIVDPLTGCATAEIKPKQPILAPGMIGKMNFKTNQRKVFLVNEQAVVIRGKSSFIRVVENAKAKYVPVKVVQISKGMAEISVDAKPGVPIVTAANKFVADGQAVTVQQKEVSKK